MQETKENLKKQLHRDEKYCIQETKKNTMKAKHTGSQKQLLKIRNTIDEMKNSVEGLENKVKEIT